MTIKAYSAIVGIILILVVSVMSGVNYTIDGQQVFQYQTSDQFRESAKIAIESKAGIIAPPVNGRVLKYAMMLVMKLGCVLFGSNHLLPATAKEMPSKFGTCKNFLNGWVTGGAVVDRGILVQLAIRQGVRVFVWEMSPRWYYIQVAEWLVRKWICSLSAHRPQAGILGGF